MYARALEPFGLEVRDIDLSVVSRREADALPRLIAGARVAVFRGQQVDDRGFIRFLRMLGDLTFTPGETPVAGAEHLNVVTNLGRAQPPRSVFHSDTSYVACPPSFTALRPVSLPASGGDTLFSDQVGTAAGLPPKIRKLLEGRTVLHSVSGLDGRSESFRHPLLRRHPLTGEVALFLSTPERCTEVSGLDARASAAIISALYNRSIRPATLYRHTWQPGDVLIWDNRVTMHRADHDQVDGDRILHRGMVCGEATIAA